MSKHYPVSRHPSIRFRRVCSGLRQRLGSYLAPLPVRPSSRLFSKSRGRVRFLQIVRICGPFPPSVVLFCHMANKNARLFCLNANLGIQKKHRSGGRCADAARSGTGIKKARRLAGWNGEGDGGRHFFSVCCASRSASRRSSRSWASSILSRDFCAISQL